MPVILAVTTTRRRLHMRKYVISLLTTQHNSDTDFNQSESFKFLNLLKPRMKTKLISFVFVITVFSYFAIAGNINLGSILGKGGRGGGGGGGGGGMMPNAITNLISTLKIVSTLCYIPTKNGRLGTNNPWVAKKFIGCYDGVEGKELYFKCMRRSNGFLLDTEDHIRDAACKMPWNTPGYIMCLMQEFQKKKIDLNAATAKVNACQSKAVGVGRSE